MEARTEERELERTPREVPEAAPDIGVLDEMGTIDYVGESVADLVSPLLVALLLCFIGAVVSAFASSTAVLGSLIPLTAPFLQADRRQPGRLHRRDGRLLDHRRRQPVLHQRRAGAGQRPPRASTGTASSGGWWPTAPW
jgi:hypothetical protein